MQKRYSVLSYNIGEYEAKVREIKNPKPDVEYVFVTNNKALTSSTWTIKYVEDPHPEDPFYLCYDIRFNPFKYVNTDIVLRIDGNMEIVGDTDVYIDEFNRGNYDICLMIHPTNETMADEYHDWEQFRESSIDHNSVILNRMKAEGYDVDTYRGMYQGGFTIQRNNEVNNDINTRTFNMLLELAPSGCVIERVDQTVWTYIINKFHSEDLKVLPVDIRVFNNTLIQVYDHGSDDKITWNVLQKKSMLFNKETKTFFPKNSQRCVVVVPVYKSSLSKDEERSLWQARAVLAGFDICFVAPQGLDLKGERVEYFPADFFKSRLDYGRLLNTVDFYARFAKYEYMLVYQLDCWVFKNELDEWCDKGYDYIGAPFFVKWFAERNLYVGNGGFSLRKIRSMITYIKNNGRPGVPHFGTDDGFFAANFDKSLNIPRPEIAALFSLEAKPREQYERTHVLPFGCHAYKRYDWPFWQNFIIYDALKTLKDNITFAILNYGNDENAANWYRAFRGYLDTYIIDTKCLDNNLPNPFTEFGNDPHILFEHNVYNGGQRIIAYNKMVNDGRKWLMTVDADVEMCEDDTVQRLLYSLEQVVSSDDIGVYETSAVPGSKCMGATQLMSENLHLYKQGSNGFRTVEGGEGWFRLVRKDIADRIYPFQNFEDNKYGWGGEAHYYLAKQLGLKTVIDDTVSLYHPTGITYDNKEAVVEREKFMARFPELGIEIPRYKAANEITTLICCIGKNENRYVRHYVEWYLSLGVTHICIYDNNDPDGEHFEDVIGDYINDGFVDIVDVRGKKVIQLQSYTECYAKWKDTYDWILFIDCGDEYLSFSHPWKIGEYLALPQFRNYDMIHVNLMTFGDNDKMEVTDEPLWTRFPNPMPFDTCVAYSFPEDMHVSSIVRGGLPNIQWTGKGFTHTPSPNNLRCCNNVGFYVDSESPFAPVDFQLAAFRHYTTKTAREYCDKMRRGFPDQLWDGSRVKNLIETRFFRTNAVTKEKVEIFKNELGIDMSYLLPKEEKVVEKDNDIKIYSLCYSSKQFEFLNDRVITPLQVGAANGTDVCRTKDNTGDNISEKNYFYIENTGTYWIWKNVNAKIKGQMQYRRPLSGVTEDFDFEKAFENYDVITCAPFHHPDHKVPTAEEPMVIPADTVEEGYAFSNCIDDLYILEMVIKSMYPEYSDDYDKYIKKGPDLYYSNGFIMKADDYDRYCEFLFACLKGYLDFSGIKNEKELYDHVKYNIEVGKYPRYQGQKEVPAQAVKWQMSIGGFLSERIWTLWLLHNFKDERILKIPYIKQEEGMFT